MRTDKNAHMTPITAIREGTIFTRSTTAVVITTFLALILAPTAAAARETINDPTKLFGKPAAVQERDELNDALKQARIVLQRMDQSLKKGAMPTADVEALEDIEDALVEADEKVMDGFDADLAHINKHKLPDVIRQRHAAAVAEYKAKHKEMLGHFAGIKSGKDAASLAPKLKAAKAWLDGQQLEPKAAPFDPNKLGFQVETKKARAPKLTSKELKAVIPASSAVIPAKAGIRSSSLFGDPIQVASTGPMSGLLAASAVAAPGAEYLAGTTDVQITPEIQALAATLHNNPVEIYSWVRNNVEWIPTYGSVQGSQMTLDKKAGNAFDTSSLLIALLRASGIPSRYAYGTIQVPVAQAMNWAGGFTNPDALQTFLATGGIPNNALTSGGVSKYIRMEHIWVEAFVDYYPSRGARNIAPDTWVPMDASFKQYTYIDGIDLQVAVPFDAEGLLAAAKEGATVNEQEKWAQNLNQANIQSGLSQYQQQLRQLIESLDHETTIGDVIGAKAIRPAASPVLAAGLPYKLVSTGNRYSALPSSSRHTFQYSLYANAHERSIENPLWTFVEATPNLAGRKVTLTFAPATDADRQTIESYLPDRHADGSPIELGEFPTFLPAYSVRVTAELRVDGSVVARGGTFTLGTELVGEGGFTSLHDLNEWDLTQERQISGQASALAISLQGISAEQLKGLESRLSGAVGQLSRGELGSGGAQLSGDLLIAAAWSYFAVMESFGRVVQRRAGMVDTPALAYGFLHAKVTPAYQYGLVHRIHFRTLEMDIGHARRVSFSKSGNTAEWVNYNRLRGKHASALEHFVPEAFLSDPTQAQHQSGVSAEKALTVAAQQGQRIFTITTENQGSLAMLSHSPTVMTNVRSALAAGKEVVIHERAISHAGFVGAGYEVIDPQTGAGSYLIEGGADGGVIDYIILCLTIILFIATPFLALLTIGPLAALISALFVSWNLVGLIEGVEAIQEDPDSTLLALSFFIVTYFIAATLGFILAGNGWGLLTSQTHYAGSRFLIYNLISFAATNFFSMLVLP